MLRIIAHLDMDAYFAAIEERDNPHLRGKPVVIGADPKNGMGRGVVSTANYPARVYGIHSAMPISTAWRLSQNAARSGKPLTVFLPVDMVRYVKVSEKIMVILKKYVPVVEQTSIDEAYLDLSFTGNYEEAVSLVKKIKTEIYEKENLTASVGIGPNKLIAKLISSKFKPNGLKVITENEVRSFLDPLPVGDIPGIGPKTEEVLHKQRIFRVSDLTKISREQLIQWFGKWGSDMFDKARGMDAGIVSAEHEIKSISSQETFDKDNLDSPLIIDKLYSMSESVIKNMKSEKITGFKTVTITVRFFDFETKSKAHSLKDYANSPQILKVESLKLLLPFLDKRSNPKLKPIRLIGVGIENFR